MAHAQRHILYDLWEPAEWPPDHNGDGPAVGAGAGLVRSAGAKLLSPLFRLRNLFVPQDILDRVSLSSPWHLAISGNGDLLAVLKSEGIEIRDKIDGYAAVRGALAFDKDPLPQWRCISWSPESSTVAFTFSTGHVAVVDRNARQFRLASTSDTPRGGPGQAAAVACLEWGRKVRGTTGSESSDFELISLDYGGVLKTFVVSVHDGAPQSICNHRIIECLVGLGVSAIAYDASRGLLWASGPVAQGDGLGKSISAWREIGEAPFLTAVDGAPAPAASGGGGFARLGRALRAAAGFGTPPPAYVASLRVSPDSAHVATLMANGQCHVLQLPSLRHVRSFGAASESTETVTDSGGANNGVWDVAWWSPSTLAIAWENGELVVASLESGANLLGRQAERCEPRARLATPWHGSGASSDGSDGMLVLEAVGPGTTGSGEAIPTAEGFASRIRATMGAVLHFMADSDRDHGAHDALSSADASVGHRLLWVRPTTPENLFRRHIEAGEYGDALVLAQLYGLDADLVYMRQWSKVAVSRASIKDYLSKIGNIEWVVAECIARIPHSFESARLLLDYGLKRAVVERLAAKTTVDITDSSDRSDVSDGDGPAEEMVAAVNVLGSAELSEAEVATIRSRRILLQFLDRLSSYEAVCRCTKAPFDEDGYRRFREADIVEVACEFASAGSLAQLQVVLHRHAEVGPHILALLSRIPETIDPRKYAEMCPTREGTSAIKCQPWRALDWAEQDSAGCPVRQRARHFEDRMPPYDDDARGLGKYCLSRTDVEVASAMAAWYGDRAQEIEAFSGLVDFALALVDIGAQRGFGASLQGIRQDLQCLRTIVYAAGAPPAFGLSQLLPLDTKERIRMMLASSGPESIVQNVRDMCLPYLRQIASAESGRTVVADITGPLRECLVEFAAEGQFNKCLAVLRESRASLSPTARIIADDRLLIETVIDCAYAHKGSGMRATSELRAAADILPRRENDIASETYRALFSRVDAFLHHVSAAEILARHSQPQPLAYFVDCDRDSDAARTLLLRIARGFGRGKSQARQEWRNLHADLCALRLHAFPSLTESCCHSAYAAAVLSSGRPELFDLVRELWGSDHGAADVSHAEAAEIVTTAAREYFNSAASLGDPSLGMARKCLQLVPVVDSQVSAEQDLLEAVDILNAGGVDMLPVQVRLCGDRFELVQRYLWANATTYKRPQRLLELCRALGVCRADGAGGVILDANAARALTALGSRATELGDYAAAYGVLADVVAAGHSVAWEACRDLSAQAAGSLAPEQCRRLAAFAVAHAPASLAGGCLSLWRAIEAGEACGSFSGDLNVCLQQLRQEWASDGGVAESVRGVTELAYGPFSASLGRPFDVDSSGKVYTRTWSECASAALELADKVELASLHSDVARDNNDEGRSSLSQRLFRASAALGLQQEGYAIDAAVALAIDCVARDTPLAIGVLLGLPHVADAERCLAMLSNSEPIYMMAACVFALRVCERFRGSSNPPPAEEDLLVFTLGRFLSVAEPWIRSLPLPSPLVEEDVSRACTVARQYLEILVNSAQARVLEGLGQGVDVPRFARDDAYKKDVILLLASSRGAVLSTAMTLAERYNVPKFEVALRHVEYLLLESGVGVKELAEATDSLSVHIIANAALSAARLVRLVERVDGRDHARLAVVVSLLADCAAALGPAQEGPGVEAGVWFMAGLPWSEHLAMLRKLRQAAGGLDYKALVCGTSSERISAIAEVLADSNVHVLARLVARIPGSGLAASQVFLMHLTSSMKAAIGGDWEGRFAAISNDLGRLSAPDFISFANFVCLDPDVVSRVTLPSRALVARALLSFAEKSGGVKGKKGRQRGLPAADDDADADVGDAVPRIRQILSHLAAVSAVAEGAFRDSSCDYVREFDDAFGAERKILRLAAHLVIDGASGGDVTGLLETVKLTYDATIALRAVISEAVELALTGLLSGEDSVAVSRLERAARFAMSAASVDEQGEWIDRLRSFCADPGVPLKCREKALAVLEKHASHSTDSILYLRATALLKASQGKEVSPANVSSAENRVAFVEALAKESGASVALLGLLRLFAAADGCALYARLYAECVMALVRDGETVSLEDACRESDFRKSLDVETDDGLFEALRDGTNARLACLFAVHSVHARVRLHGAAMIRTGASLSSREDAQAIVSDVLRCPAVSEFVVALADSSSRFAFDALACAVRAVGVVDAAAVVVLLREGGRPLHANRLSLAVYNVHSSLSVGAGMPCAVRLVGALVAGCKFRVLSLPPDEVVRLASRSLEK